MADTKGVREMTFAEAAKALVDANKVLQSAASGAARCQAALAFAVAERNARGAKKRESEGSVLDLLEKK